jgi:excisionase family DNA binding protein
MDKQAEAIHALLTIHELAQVLKVSVRTVESLIRANRAPPFIRVGRARRWRTGDVDAWLAQQVGSSKA